MLVCRKMDSQQEEDVKALLNSRVFTKWREAKNSVHCIVSILIFIITWAFTVYIIYFIAISGEDGNLKPMFKPFVHRYIAQVQAAAAAKSITIFNNISISSMTPNP